MIARSRSPRGEDASSDAALGPATTLQGYPLLPAEFKPPVPATNRAVFGYAFDRDTSPPELGLLHVNAGGLAASTWLDTEEG